MTAQQPHDARQPQKIGADLGEVPETALWTLYHRAVEARRWDTVLPDPEAVDLLDRIDYPFAERFGPAGGITGQVQALRVRCFDREVTDFLIRCPRGTVVCLGEGLETQYWRVDNGRAQWLSVDLPEAVALREKLLPPGPRQRLLPCSATDPAWMDEVDPEHGVLITAQGLLMYLAPEDVHGLLGACAARFGGETIAAAPPNVNGAHRGSGPTAAGVQNVALETSNAASATFAGWACRVIGSVSRPPSDRVARSIDCSCAIFSNPPGFLRSASQMSWALESLSTMMIRARSLSPYWASNAFLRSSGVTSTRPVQSFRRASAG